MEMREGLIGAGCAAIGAIVAAIVRVLRKPSSPAEMTAVAQVALGEAIDRLEHEIGRLTTRVSDLEKENNDCRGENRQLWQRIDSLEELLRREGVPLAAREMPGSFIHLEGGRVTVLRPDNSGKGDVDRDGDN